MKILIGYPPASNKKGTPLLSQNRQFQYFNNPTYIFPIIPAYAATLLKNNNYKVIWKDAIAENTNKKEFFEYLRRESPDLFMFETKTPIIQEHWKTINEIKNKFPEIKIAIAGDHVTALPSESLKNSKVDYVITGGDFDFSLLELCDHLTKKTKLPKGIYYKEKNKIKNTGKFELNHNLDELPLIDRKLTRWHQYQKEYNIKVRPFMYIMSGRDCWYGKCKFCAWPVIFPKFRLRSVKSVVDEIGNLIEKYGVKEIFDDAGTFPTGAWLKDFCNEIIKRKYHKKITISCNMRFNALNLEEYQLMKKANFRLLKFGLESANQGTLDKLNKNINIKDIVKGCKLAKKAGLTVHLTMIIGHPWETKKEALKTFNLAKKLMTSGLADVLQSTVIVPYPGTPLWKEAIKKKWFRFNPNNYKRYDMSEPVLKTVDMSPEEVMQTCNKVYKIFISPKYIYQHIKRINSLNDVKYTLNGVKAIFGHMKDFSRK
ncbi:MAG: B12-binding domain-containing radical SAM protein [Nanoarchaeota archaeon]|nr:B12-binding domain-containing radical SAM protein [Nanoarchaeota archaeon]